MKPPRPTPRSLQRFQYFLWCKDVSRMPEIKLVPDGYTAAECFHAWETHGQELPCREPDLLARAMNGKMWHGVTVEMVATDYVDRIAFAEDIRKQYPPWVAAEIFAQASKIAMQKIGFVPTFVSTGNDFTTLEN